MLLIKRKTNPDFGYLKELRLAQDFFEDDMKVSRVLWDTKQDVEELGRKILLVWNIGAIEI